MSTTPDRAPGPSEEERTDYDVQVGASTTAEGQVLYSDGKFKLRDVIGEFDPRGAGGISAATHQALRQLIHFVDDGPANGFPSGSFRETLPTGNPFPTSAIWYESSAKLKKIVSLEISYTGAFPTTEVWKVFDVDGSTVLATLTDAIVHSGAFESTRTRTIA